MPRSKNASKPNVGLFVTCLVDLFRPSVGFAAVKLLEDAGCRVHVPASQTCCGQPAWNSGDTRDTIKIAKKVIDAFESLDFVVAPSGSCAGILKTHYVEVFEKEPGWAERAFAFSDKVHELTAFLVDVMGVSSIESTFDGTVTYHDSCAGLRELGVANQPRKLLKSVQGLNLTEMDDSTTCCGFGGTFCVKYSEISNAIVSTKVNNIEKSNASLLLAGDLGCLLNMGGKLSRNGSTVEVRHVAEILAGLTDQPPIGSAEN